jgi:hypothetical protein
MIVVTRASGFISKSYCDLIAHVAWIESFVVAAIGMWRRVIR